MLIKEQVLSYKTNGRQKTAKFTYLRQQVYTCSILLDQVQPAFDSTQHKHSKCQIIENLQLLSVSNKESLRYMYTVFQKTSTHIIGYKLRNSCLILIIFGTKIPHII